jgi:CheY-like chemotaxis protein
VLVVDDNAVNQKVAVSLLRHLNFDATVVSNGLSALEAIQQGAFDAVLMDSSMPVMDGLTATKKIREVLKEEKLPIIALTAGALAEDREACLAAGMTDYLAKPVQLEALRQVLDRSVGTTDLESRPVRAIAGFHRSAGSTSFSTIGDPAAKCHRGRRTRN